MHGRICTGDMQILSILCKELEYLQFGRWGVPGMNLPHPHSHGYRERTVKFSLFVNPWIAARQASLSITNSWSSLKLLSIQSVMPSSHLILCRPLFHLPSIPPSIRVFSNESTLRIRCPKYWSNRWGNNGNSDRLLFLAPKSLQMVTAAMKLKDACSLEEKLWPM